MENQVFPSNCSERDLSPSSSELSLLSVCETNIQSSLSCQSSQSSQPVVTQRTSVNSNHSISHNNNILFRLGSKYQIFGQGTYPLRTT